MRSLVCLAFTCVLYMLVLNILIFFFSISLPLRSVKHILQKELSLNKVFLFHTQRAHTYITCILTYILRQIRLQQQHIAHIKVILLEDKFINPFI